MSYGGALFAGSFSVTQASAFKSLHKHKHKHTHATTLTNCITCETDENESFMRRFAEILAGQNAPDSFSFYTKFTKVTTFLLSRSRWKIYKLQSWRFWKLWRRETVMSFTGKLWWRFYVFATASYCKKKYSNRTVFKV